MAAYVDVQVDLDARWIPLPRSRAIPDHFWATVDDPNTPHLVKLEVVVSRGSPAVRQLVVQRREDSYPFGPAVTSVNLRKVNVAACMRAALDAAARSRTDVRSDRWPGAFTVEGLGNQVYGGPSAAHGADRSRLQRVAEAYLAAKTEGTSSRRAVMTAAGIQSSQAARLIRAAKDAGLIPRGDGLSPRDAHALHQEGEVVVANHQQTDDEGGPD